MVPVLSSFRLGTTSDPIVTGMNLHIPSSVNASFYGNISQLLIGSGTNSQARRVMRGSTSTGIISGNDAIGTLHGEESYNRASTGTHPLFAAMAIKAPLIAGSGAATVTRAATLVIDGAPTGLRIMMLFTLYQEPLHQRA